jgi:hypothetical protein
MATVEQTIDQLVSKARKAADIMKHFAREQVDRITATMDAASVANEVKLAGMPLPASLPTHMLFRVDVVAKSNSVPVLFFIRPTPDERTRPR